MCAVENNISSKKKPPPMTQVTKKIFVKHIWGVFQKRRWLVFSFFLTLFYLSPWLRIAGRPPILFDLPERKFHIFSITLWPQDIYLLTIILITAAVGLFFSTAIVGRVWCGYLCPQTVFTSVFIEIERFIIGDKTKQLRLAKQPLKNKIGKILTKNSVWGIIAFSAGFTFLSYFIPNDEIIRRIFSGELNGWAAFWLIFISALAFFDFGYFREQFCFVPCPYGRFQGALQDPNSLVVTYDKVKGEGNPSEKIAPACIDCKLCVQVCPTGIDIRNGAQFECISCARCIDACTIVQIKQKRTPDLIRYASENELNGLPTKIIRPRIIIYTIILAIAISFISFQLLFRPGFDLDIVRNRNIIYQELPNGKISNIYNVKLLNMSNENQVYEIKTEKIGVQMITGKNPIEVKSGEVYETNVTLIADKDSFSEKVNEFEFVLERKVDNKTVKEKSTFIKP